jgi:hypothetical protein
MRFSYFNRLQGTKYNDTIELTSDIKWVDSSDGNDTYFCSNPVFFHIQNRSIVYDEHYGTIQTDSSKH